MLEQSNQILLLFTTQLERSPNLMLVQPSPSRGQVLKVLIDKVSGYQDGVYFKVKLNGYLKQLANTCLEMVVGQH